MSSPAPQPIREWHGVTAEQFKADIVPLYQPAVLRGVASHWPAVQAARRSAEDAARYIAGLDNGQPVDALLMRPQEKGRIFYAGDMSGFNFVRNQLPVTQVLEQVFRYAAFEDPPRVAVQSALVRDCLPGFTDANRLDLLDDTVAPRLWFGNRVTTPAHFDESDNIACVVAGRRRFTLFPPEQVGNLYIGPLDFAPTGTPISMVSLDQPDLQRFPRFAQALAAAQSAELEPGDAIYIPPLWWHHVESLLSFNVLVNYWWRPVPNLVGSASALPALLHAILKFRHLPPEQRAGWAAIFQHFVFNAEDPAAHVPEARKGVLGDITPERAKQVRDFIVDQLRDPPPPKT